MEEAQRVRARTNGVPDVPFAEAARVWTLLGFTSFGGAPPGGTYVPAKVGDNGQVIPGHFQ